MTKNIYYQILIFFSAASVAVLINFIADPVIVLKILAAFIIFFLILLRIAAMQKAQSLIGNKLVYIGIIWTVSIFLITLVISTGGFTSPFFVLTHIAILTLAFLATFISALIFLLASLCAISISVLLSSRSIGIDTPNILVDFFSFGAIVPLAAIVAHHYSFKDKLADYLFSELFLSQKEESLIFENIEEGLISLDREFAVVKMNKIAENLSGHESSNIVGRDFFEIFKFFDRDKKIIQKEHFPIKIFLAKPSGFTESVFLQKPNGLFVNIDFKFSSILGPEGTVRSFLFVFNPKEASNTSSSIDAVMLQTFKRFSELLTTIYAEVDELRASAHQQVTREATLPQLNKNSKRILHAYRNLEILYKLGTGGTPGLLFDQDVGDLVRKVIHETTDLAKEYGVALINSTPLSPPLPIRFNKIVFEQVVSKIIELGVFIAAESPEKFVIVSTGSSPENIFVFVKISSFNNFPWEQASELIKPFFGTLSERKELSQATGLEGYLVESLLKEKNIEGGITGGKFEDGIHNPQLILTIILPFSNKS